MTVSVSHPIRQTAPSPLASTITLGFALTLALSSSAACAAAQATLEPSMASVLVTATRSAQSTVEVLSDHVVISTDDIERSGATNVIDLLQKQRGIEVNRNGGPGAASQVFIRGGDARQNVVLVDGIRIGSSTSGIANWAALPLANVERIEIVYGPLATMYGADAIGGVVHIFTRRGAGPAAPQAGLSAGSAGARAALAGVSGATEGPNSISYALSAMREQDDGFSATRAGLSSHHPDRDGYRKESVAASIGMAITAGHEAGMRYMHNHLLAQYDAGAGAFDSRSVQNLDHVALYSKHQLTRAWGMSLQAAQADDQALTLANASASGTSRIETRQRHFSMQHDIALGSDLLQVLLERRNEAIVSSSIAPANSGRSTNSVALAYSLRRGAHLGSASVRRDDSSVYGAEVTGGLAYGYRVTPALRINASAGTSFRAPTFNELYFPNFGVSTNRPEQGKNAEAGLYYGRNGTQVSAVYYRNRMTDLLVNTSVCPIRTDIYKNGCSYNVARASLDGLSIGGHTQVGNIDLQGSMDFQDPRDETSGKSLIRRARRHAKLGADYAAGALSAGINLHLSGRRFDDAANRNALGGYALVSLHGAYRFTPDWSAVLKLNNVADKQYELARFYNTAGRQVFAGIRYGVR